MHSSNPSSRLFLNPCKSTLTQYPIFNFPKLSSRKLAKSLRTSIDYEQDEEVSKEELVVVPSNATRRLPITIKTSGKVSRYFIKGDSLELLLCVDEEDGVGDDGRLDDGFLKFIRLSSSAAKDFFIPKQVSENYVSYVKWKFLHRVFSSALQVLATQAMFRAIGIGQSRSLASSAAFNWILKDGLGRLSRCIYTASLASAFDTNLKRVRFSTSVLFSLSIGVELMTPVFPKYFLLLASIANIAKQISLSCYLATGSAVHRSFAVADNLGEVSAKAQIQTVCFDNLGLLLAVLLNMLFQNNQRLQASLPFVLYPIFSTFDLLGIYQGLKHINLQTLTKNRLEIILERWIEFRQVPSPAEVSEEEGIDLLGSRGSKRVWPIRIGCLDPKAQIPALSMMVMQSLCSDDGYFITMELSFQGFRRIPKLGIVICLREGANSVDIITSLLQTCYIRKSLGNNRIKRRDTSSDLTPQDWSLLTGESKLAARDDSITLNKQMQEQGWIVKNVLLSAEEQIRYIFHKTQL
ncbi:PREDICTED: protein root UVB sensitive 4-like [Camelina sativa]|uniref:Protein root UVB sensitive 4-like n=1 Tax=Camelina sativa TaxID=90675 RepID=A0ABM0WKE0_CAMSA|nr:PREDICTED: protein root UVB sensitive 4-like [Camelina sativa]